MKRKKNLQNRNGMMVLAGCGHGCLRAGQVRTEIAERNRVLGLQGLRGLAGGLLRPHRRVLKVIVANPNDDQRLQGRRCRQRPAFPGRLEDRKAAVEAEEDTEAPFVVDVPDVFTQRLS